MQILEFKPIDHKIKALIYGPSGSGKTVFGGTANNSIFASAEGGLLALREKRQKYTPIKSLKDLKELYSYLLNEKHEFETVIIDSISEINEIIKLEIEKKTGHSMQLQDWGTLQKDIRDLFRKFRDLPMHVIFIAQEQYINDEDKIKKIAPSLNGKSATDVAYFMDIVGFIHIENDGSRWIQTSSSKKLFTKDRSQKIGDECPMDFEIWKERVAEIETGKQEVKVEYEASNEITETEGAVQSKNLTDLKLALFDRGAKDEKAAIKLLNESIGTQFQSLSLRDDQAQKALYKLLLIPKPEVKVEAKKAETKTKTKAGK